MKKILFDLTKTQPVDGSKFHGGGKYGAVVFKKLVEKAPEKVAMFYNESVYLDPSIEELCMKFNIPMERKSSIDVVSAAKKYGGVLYSPLNDPSYIKDPSVHAIVTIHGLRVLEMPYDEYESVYAKRKKLIEKLLGNTFIYKLLLSKKRKNDFIKNWNSRKKSLMSENLSFVTVSNHSKYSLLSFFPTLNENNIKVFYSPSTIDDSISLDDYKNIYGKYFLIVSGNRWLKNSARAILALDEIISEHPDFEGKVVVTGIQNRSELNVKIKNESRFVFRGYVDEVELKGLYHNAHLLVYPSLNEGFGYPPLEAMHEGCPVISSAIASIPEVCGDAVMYFNPYSIPEIKMRILQMENDGTRDLFVNRGIEQQKKILKKQHEDLDLLINYILSFI